MSSRRVVLSCMVLLLGVAVVAAQQPARQPLRQPLPPGTGAQPRQPGQIDQQGQVIQQRQPGQIGQQGQVIQRQPGQIGQQGQFGQQRQFGQQGQRGQWDQPLITLLIIDNNKEIALGRLAEQTSKNEKVQQFAQMIQKDHGNFVQKLQELTATSGTRGARLDPQPRDVAEQPGRAGVAERADRAAERVGRAAERVGEAAERAGQAIDSAIRGDRDLADRPDQDRQRGERDRDLAERRDTREGAEATTRHTVARPVIANTPGSELLLFWQDVAEECVNSARKEAQQQSPEEFDKLFVAAQVLGHKGMLDKLRIAERNASPQLAQLLRDAQGTTKQHLEHAEQLHADLGKGQTREGGAIRERSPLREDGIERREGAPERRERQEQ